MQRRTAIFFAVLTTLATGCIHTSRLERAGCEVDFHGGRLNGAPVEDRELTVEGHPFTVETSQFVYEINPPFQALQAVISLSSADPGIALAGTSETLQGVLAGFTSSLPKILAGTRCDAAVPDGSFSPFGLEQRCKVIAQGVDYAIRVRAVPARRGLLIQVASWTTEKGKTWSDAFWASLREVPGALPAPGATAVQPASKDLGSDLAEELFGAGGQSGRATHG